MTVFLQVPSPRHHLKIFRPVIELVPVPMVDEMSPGNRPVRQLPRQYGTETPDIRLGNLHPCSLFPVAAGAGPHSDGPDRRTVDRTLAAAELSFGRATDTLRRRSQVAGPLRSAGVRAVVDSAALGRLPMKQDATDGTRQVRLDGWPPKSRTVPLTARGRAEQQAAPIAGEPIRLHTHLGPATATRCVDHTGQSIAGSDTTLNVATRHAAEAIA